MSGRTARLCARIYAASLRVLPEPFRATHRREMETLFGDRVAEADRGLALVILLIGELVDVVRTAARLRRGGAADRSAHAPISPRSGGAILPVVRDVAVGVRQSFRHPAHSLAAFGVMAVGIGATTSIFAVVDSVALRPLAHADADRLVVVGQTVPSLGDSRVPMSFPNYVDLRSTPGTGLAGLAVYRWPSPLRVSMGGSPEVYGVSAVGGGLFGLLGNRAALGRAIDESDERSEARVAVLGHALWRTRFGSDSAVVGRTVQIEGQPWEVVGVMEPSFSFPVPAADLFIPLRRIPPMEDRDTRFMGVVARLEPGVSLDEARRRMRAAMDRLVAMYPVENEGNGIRLDPLRSVVLGDDEPVMMLLFGAVLLLLLLSCASVANLVLARTASRSSEFAMRRALGAGRGRLAVQLLGESLALALAAGAAGFVLAAVATRLLTGLVPASLPRVDSIGFDVRTYLFAAVITLGSGLLFGVAPALRGSGSSSATVLRAAAGGVVGRSRHRLLRGLVAAQVAITVVLALGGGLLANSFIRLVTLDPGLDPDGVVTLRVALPAGYDDPRRVDGFFEELIERASALPGVRAAGATWALPFTPDWASGRVTVEGDPRPRGEELLLGMVPVRGRYFAALGMRLVEGRLFEPADYAGARAALSSEPGTQGRGLAVINEAAARAMWPGQESVVGRRFRTGRADEEKPWFTVVGVVRDAKRFGLSAPVEPEFYQMHPQALWASDLSLVVRSDGDPAAMLASLIRIVRDMDPSLAVTRAGPVADLVRRSVAEPRFHALVVAAFGIASLALALAGVYGVLAFAVSLRTREIGVRMALGAARSRVLRAVLGEGAAVIATGLIIGLLAAAAGAAALRSQLFGIGPFDVVTWLIVAGTIATAGLAACWMPARRASRIAPASAMRS